MNRKYWRTNVKSNTSPQKASSAENKIITSRNQNTLNHISKANECSAIFHLKEINNKETFLKQNGASFRVEAALVVPGSEILQPSGNEKQTVTASRFYTTSFEG